MTSNENRLLVVLLWILHRDAPHILSTLIRSGRLATKAEVLAVIRAYCDRNTENTRAHQIERAKRGVSGNG